MSEASEKAASRAARDYRFCDQCDVSLDLHDGDDTCDTASLKANLIDTFFGVFDRRFDGRPSR